jgi:hypothetical protein
MIPKFTKQIYLVLRMKNKNFPEGPLAGVKFIVQITLYCVRYDLTVELYSCIILISFSFSRVTGGIGCNYRQGIVFIFEKGPSENTSCGTKLSDCSSIITLGLL